MTDLKKRKQELEGSLKKIQDEGVGILRKKQELDLRLNDLTLMEADTKGRLDEITRLIKSK